MFFCSDSSRWVTQPRPVNTHHVTCYSLNALQVPIYHSYTYVELVRNVMAHAQKPDFVFRPNGRVHLNRWGRQFSRLLAAEVCASGWVMLDRPCSEVAWEYWLPTPFASFPFSSPPVRHRVPPGSKRALRHKIAMKSKVPFCGSQSLYIRGW